MVRNPVGGVGRRYKAYFLNQSIEAESASRTPVKLVSPKTSSNLKYLVGIDRIHVTSALMSTKFDILTIKPELLKTLGELKFNVMTPIQAMSLPRLLQGTDVIAQAKTGSGKTVAFGLCILDSLDASEKSIHSLVLCPTRELTEQVALEIRRLARNLKNIKVLTICGGLTESVQEKSLSQGVHIVVGTPGRVLRLLEKNTLDLSKIKIFTLDEADRMLDMGFYDDLIKVVRYLPKKRQSLLFSATYPKNILDLSKKIQREAFDIKVDTEHKSNEINEVFYAIKPNQDKNDFLFKILGSFRPERALVFCGTKKDSYDVAQFLNNRGVATDCLNGDLEQKDRTKVLTKFLNRSLSVLVATDVAARGIDVQELPTVINFNMPPTAEAYIHRIGRTGRAGHKGEVFSFVTAAENHKLDEISSLTQKRYLPEDPLKITYSNKFDLIPPMKTIYISGGKKDKLRPGDIVGAIVGEAKIDAKDIGDISVLNVLSYVAINRKDVDLVIKKLSTGKIKKRKFKVGLA